MANRVVHGVVSDFLIHRGRQYLPGLEEHSAEMVKKAQELYEVDGDRLPSPSQMEPPKASKRLETFVAEYSLGIRTFLQRLQDKEASLAVTSGASWDKLREEAEMAWAAYNNHKSRKRSWRRPFEVLDNAAEKVMGNSYIEFLLELIPNGEYSSLLSGGLTLAYNTAIRKERFRENILELFESLSDRAEKTKGDIQLYSRDAQLHAKSEELYMAVIDCVRHSTAWLDRPSATESFKAFFQQIKYGRKWEDAKAHLDRKVKEFDETVNMCMRRQISQIDGAMQFLRKDTQEMYSTFYSMLAGICNDFSDIRDFLQTLAAQRAANPSNIAHTTNVFYTHQPIPPPPLPTTMVSAWQLGNSCLAIDYQDQYPPPGQPLRSDPITLAVCDLKSDVDTAMYHIPLPLERKKMGYLSLTPRSITWLRSTESQFLILHEHQPPIHSSLSTLSHLCAMVSSTLNPSGPSHALVQGLWTLPFFCGLHTSANSTFQGGLGVMRGITLQLISAVPHVTFPLPSLGRIPDPTSLAISLLSDSHLDPSQSSENGNGSEAPQTTCLAFSLILSQIQAGMIFILIDGAHWNGTQARSSDMGAVIRYLYQLVAELRRARRGLVLKVLVTNPGARQRIDWGIPGTDVVNGDELEAGIGWSRERAIDLENDLYMERLVVAGGFEGFAEEVVRGFGQ